MAGTLTRDQLVTEICDVVGKRLSSASVSGASLEARARTYLDWAQRRIARFHSFYELDALQESAATVASVKRYPLTTGTNNLGLTRVKDIHSIRLIDSENSRNLIRWSYRKFDRIYPRPENYSTGRPHIYVRDGNNIEMYRIPDDAYTLYIRYPQWPTPFTSGSQTSDYDNKDELIITAGIFETYFALEEYADAKVYYQKLLGQLGNAVEVEGDVDWEPEAEPYGGDIHYGSGEPWIDPYGGALDPLHGYSE